MADRSTELEPKDGQVDVTPRLYRLHSAHTSTPSKRRDGDPTTPPSVRTENIRYMDELIQRLSNPNRQGTHHEVLFAT
jgi:hypothetical protein